LATIGGQKFFGFFGGEFIGGERIGNGGSLFTAFNEGAVATHAQRRIGAFDRKRGQLTGIDGAKISGEVSNAAKFSGFRCATAPESLELILAQMIATSDEVEDLLHPCGELVVHEVGEVLFEEANH
jgi:hypothetical protein